MRIHWAEQVGDDWAEVRAELERAFEMSRSAAQARESFVYIVRSDDLLGRDGAANAMVATGLLSAARTAALEGHRKGWTANVIAIEDVTDRDTVREWAERLLGDEVTGELIRLGASHIGKALP